MNRIILSNLKTLEKTNLILSNLNNESLRDNSVAPYNSSIGSHIRHILDFYDCILLMTHEKRIDLTQRKRDLRVAYNCSNAMEYYNYIAIKLKQFEGNISDIVFVIDDLGLGKIEIAYTLGGLMTQANSHTIHHYAIINYILEGLNISVNDPGFGYNPTSPKQTTLG